jgi:HSP20 family protein
MATKDKEKSKDTGLVKSNGNRDMSPYRRGEIEPFNRMIDQFFRGWPTLWNGGIDRNWRWGLEVQEKEAEIDVRAEAPGFEPDDFDVKVRGDQLILSASHKAESEDYGYREWSEQEFYRTVTLPADVDAGKVEAHYRNGVLDVKLPKAESSKAQKITVQG